jgi:hypothetical protein
MFWVSDWDIGLESQINIRPISKYSPKTAFFVKSENKNIPVNKVAVG